MMLRWHVPGMPRGAAEGGRVKLREAAAVVLSAFVIVACSAGGGGGGSSGGGTRTVTAPDPVSASPVENSGSVSAARTESSANYGVASIGADIAYADGAAGRGVRVAVIDSGISLDHPEFAGRIDRSASVDIVTGSRDTLEDESGHGSHVAGIIAANVDGAGMRGVAPEATLVAIRADLRDSSICGSPGCGYLDSDVAAALDHARRQGVDIVNLSLGKDSPISDAYRSALAKVIDSGALVVVAAGNQALDRPLLPGRLADASDIRGGMLVAGAVGRNNAIYGQTSKAGDVGDYFVVAPGVDIFSTYRDEGYRRLTGTSMAAPHVAGAAAVLKSAFPSLTMREVAEILARTADDLGAAGVDQTYGRGLINLPRALQPIGRQQIAVGDTVDGGLLPIGRSRLELGPAFGNALDGTTALANGMVLDAYGRPYRTDFRGLIAQRNGQIDLESQLLDDRTMRSASLNEFSSLGIDARFAVSESRNAPIQGSARAAFAADDGVEPGFERLSITAYDGAAGRASLGVGLTPSAVGGTPAGNDAGQLFLASDALLAPVDGIVDRGSGGLFRLAATPSLVLHAGVLESTALNTETGNDEGVPGRLATLGATYRMTPAVDLQFTLSHLDEAASLLGSNASGAFAFGDGAVSDLGTVRLAYRPTSGIEFFGQATLGNTRIDGGDGMLREWSDVRSDAFALGMLASNVLGDGDQLGIIIGQPLRVSDASAMLDMPMARKANGDIERLQERVDLTPTGRELRAEIAYRHAIMEASTIGTWLLLQHQPGHDASAEPALGVGVRFTGQF